MKFVKFDLSYFDIMNSLFINSLLIYFINYFKNYSYLKIHLKKF